MRIEIGLPGWVREEVLRVAGMDTLADRMAFVIRLAELNVQNGTGGPFAAAVFDLKDHALLAAAPNLVVTAGYAVAHAEVLALSLAQGLCGSFDLSRDGRACELVTSAEPCAMCLGATCWSGVAALSCGARGADVEAIGFDEGPKPADWQAALAERGIEVTCDVRRHDATAVLARYRDLGGALYNVGGSV